jgi:hypothetical protein
MKRSGVCLAKNGAWSIIIIQTPEQSLFWSVLLIMCLLLYSV